MKANQGYSQWKTQKKSLIRHLGEVIAKFDEHKTQHMELSQSVKKPKLKNSVRSFKDSPQIPPQKKDKKRPLEVKLNGSSLGSSLTLDPRS